MASFANIIKAKAAPIATPGLSHFDRILGRALGGREVEKTATPGDIVTFTTNLTKPLTSLKVLITATQSGTGDPSPTNIRPITGWTGCTVTRTGSTSQTYTTAFGDAGTVYGGTLDVLTGELTVDTVFATYTGADSEGWSLTSQGTALYKTQPLIWRANMTPICNRYLGVAPGASANIGNLKCRLSGTYSNFIVRDDDLLDVDAFKASLTANPMQVIFRLVTKQTYQLTPQAVDALLGENVVFADTGAVSELKYLVKE